MKLLPEAPSVRRRCLTALAGVLLVALGGLLAQPVQAQSPELVAAARKEGKVMVYGEMITPTMRALKAGFERKYPGMTMEFIYLSGAPLMNRVISERDAGRYLADVIAVDTVRMPVLNEKGYLVPYRSVHQDNYDREWWSDPPDLWIRNHLYLGGIMYNAKAVGKADAPKNFQDLLDPKWRGKIALVSPVANDLLFAMFAGFVRDMGEAQAYAFFKQLAAQKPLVFGPGGMRVSQGVGTGEFPIGIGFVGHTYSVGREPGYSMAFAPTDPVYAVGGPGFALFKNAPNPNAGKLVIDYMLSNEAQEEITTMGYRSNARGVKGIADLTAAKVVVAPVPGGAEAEKLRATLKQLFGG